MVHSIQKNCRCQPVGQLDLHSDPSPTKLREVFQVLPATTFQIPVRSEVVSASSSSVAPEIPTLSFLSSLCSDTRVLESHPEALPFTQGKNFSLRRKHLTEKLYELFNREVFGAALPHNMECKWNTRLTKTAGQTINSMDRKTRTARIELSAKVVDSAERLRDTLIHEMCHASAWILSNCQNGHGPIWRRWVGQALKTFPELPPIGRSHNYNIRTKYHYTCVNCGYTIGRHTKSLDTSHKVCGHCLGSFELMTNRKKASVTVVNSTTPKIMQMLVYSYGKWCNF